MDLFHEPATGPTNLLPYEGTVHYYGPVFTQTEADRYLQTLLDTVAWRQDEAVIMGKHIFTKRKVAWYGDRAFSYTYSNTTRHALPWTPALQALKAVTEQRTGETYNSCLLNLYHTGEEGMAWHSDAERDLKRNGAIGSLSFGADRKFSFKHKQQGQTVSVVLQHGSLLVMKDTTQTYWLHRLPPTKLVTRPRVNLTFRTIVT